MRGIVRVLVGLGISAGAMAPARLAAQRRMNLDRLGFPTPAAEAQSRTRLAGLNDSLVGALGRARRSPAALAYALEIYDSLTAKTLRHWWYLRLRAATDLTDRKSAESAGDLDRLLDAAGSRVTRELEAEERQGRLSHVGHDPVLSRYAFFIENARRTAGRTLPPGEERVLQGLRASVLDWEYPAYLAITAHVPAATLPPEPTSRDRATARRARFQNAGGFGDLYAQTLVQTVLGGDAVARAYGYAGAPERVYSRRYLSVDSVRAILAAVRARGDLARRYQRAQVEALAPVVGDTGVGPWEVGASAAGPSLGVDSAAAVIRRALAPLGSDYGAALAAMLDPAAERLDLGPSPNRTPGGFSFGTLGFPAGVYLATFDSTPAAVRRLAHESAHAMHRQLMATAGTAPVYFGGAPYLSEAVALLNELIVTDYLVGTARDSIERRSFEEAFLDKALDLFYSAQDAELEQAVYDGVAAGALRTAADFDSVSQRIDAGYTVWDAREPAHAHRWMFVGLMWEDPLYLVNYVYADLIGLKLFTLYKRDPTSFSSRYLAFLRAGYSDAPATLLQRHFGIRFDPDRLLDEATEALTPYLEDYEHLVRPN